MATPSGDLALKGARDAALFSLITDDASELTYGTGFDVTIQELSINPDIETVELPGDDIILDIFSKLKQITGTIKFAKVHTAALSLLWGATEGTTSSTRTLTISGDDLPGYFKIVAKVAYTGGSSNAVCLLHLFKVKMTNIEFSGNQDDYWQFSADFSAIATTYTDQVCEIAIHEADVDILS